MTSRWLWRWLAGVVYVLAFSVAADASAQTTFVFWDTAPAAPVWETPAKACASLSLSGQPGQLGAKYSDTHYGCKDYTGYPSGDVYQFSKVCSAGLTLDYATLTCVQEQEPPPPPPPSCKKTSNEYLPGLYSGDVGSQGLPSCIGGCAISVDAVQRCYTYPGSQYPKRTYCDYYGGYTGSECGGGGTTEDGGNVGAGEGQPKQDADVSAPSGGDDGSCPAGTTQGGVDSSGTPICMGSGTEPDQPPPKPPTTTEPPQTTTNADGSTTVTEVQRQTNSDGSTSTTTTTTTTAADGTVTRDTTTVVGPTPGGTTGKHDADPSDAKYDLCKTNPGLSICKITSVTGTCGQIACIGDPIQCATLRAAAIMECRQAEDREALETSPLYARGQSAIAGTDKDGLPTVENASVFNVPGSLDQSGFIGAGSCFADKTFTVQGQTITIPFSQVCDTLLVLRYAIMIVAALVSFRVLSGAVLKE